MARDDEGGDVTDPAIARREPDGYATRDELRAQEARVVRVASDLRRHCEESAERAAALRSHVDATAGGVGARLETVEGTLQAVAQDVGAIRLAVLETPSRRVVDALLRNTATTIATVGAATVIAVLGMVLASGVDLTGLSYDGGTGAAKLSITTAKGKADAAPTEADDDGGAWEPGETGDEGTTLPTWAIPAGPAPSP